MAGGWQGADYLSAQWVAEGWLLKQPYIASPGAWVNQRYISRKYVSETWLHYVVSGVGAAVSVGNVPGVALASLDGSARLTVHVNATTTATPIAVFATVANAGLRVSQVNVPGLALAALQATANGGVYQLADVTIAIEVASTFGYSKVVVAQNVPGAAVAAIDAIVTTGADVNIAVTRVDVPLGVLPTTAKANSSTLAVSTITTALQVFDCDVAVGKNISVLNVTGVGLATIPAAVTGTSNLPTNVVATLTGVELTVLNANNVGSIVDINKVLRVRRRNNVVRAEAKKRVERA